MSEDVITISKVKLFGAFAVAVITLCGGFYGGIEIAKSHADDKVRELREEQGKKIDDMVSTMQTMNDRVWSQGQNIAVIRTILEERFGGKREKNQN